MCRVSMTIQCRIYSNLHEVFWCTLVQNCATIDARENQRVHTLIILICAKLREPSHSWKAKVNLCLPHYSLRPSSRLMMLVRVLCWLCICMYLWVLHKSMNCANHANACQCTAYISQGCCWGITLPHKSVGSYCKLPKALQACLCALFFITCHARWINYDEQDWIRQPWVQHPLTSLTSTLPMN